jgi:hypothetical protein
MAVAGSDEILERKAKVARMEAKLAELRKAWDLYIQGIERIPPIPETEAFQKALEKFRRESAMWKLSQKFPVRTLQSKFTTYKNMWDRNMKQIEDGTHRRTKAKRDMLEKARKEHEAAEKAAATKGNGAAPKRAAAAGGGGGGDDAKMRKLYDVYMKARKRTGDSSNLSYEALRAKIQKQMPVLKKKHGGKDVEFKVVLKNGKAVLKAVPK